MSFKMLFFFFQAFFFIRVPPFYKYFLHFLKNSALSRQSIYLKISFCHLPIVYLIFQLFFE